LKLVPIADNYRCCLPVFPEGRFLIYWLSAT